MHACAHKIFLHRGLSKGVNAIVLSVDVLCWCIASSTRNRLHLLVSQKLAVMDSLSYGKTICLCVIELMVSVQCIN